MDWAVWREGRREREGGMKEGGGREGGGRRKERKRRSERGGEGECSDSVVGNTYKEA